MMNFDYFISLTKKPNEVQEKDCEDLLKLCKKYPYFGLTRWLYLKSLKEGNSLDFKKELKLAAMHAPDRKQLYFFIHPEELQTKKRERSSNATGSYFDIIDNYDSEENSENKLHSLTSLAQRLKDARNLLQTEEQEEHPEEVINETFSQIQSKDVGDLGDADSEKVTTIEELQNEHIETTTTGNETTKNIVDLEALILEKEHKVKNLITKEKKYKEAIALLDELILINPKKSVYFADQIHFLQKILEYNQ